MQKRYLEAMIFFGLFAIIGLAFYSQYNASGEISSIIRSEAGNSNFHYHAFNWKLLYIWLGLGIIGSAIVFSLDHLKKLGSLHKKILTFVSANLLFVAGVLIDRTIILKNSDFTYFYPASPSYQSVIVLCLITSLLYTAILMLGDKLEAIKK